MDWRDRRVLLAFSDPAGAKAMLAFAGQNLSCVRSMTCVSDRTHDFLGEFGIPVQRYSERANAAWLSDADVLITGTSLPYRLELELIATARTLGIPSAAFADHWTNLAARFMRGGTLVMPDEIWVVDERAKRIALSEGLPESALVVTGNPYHEHLRGRLSEPSRDATLASLGLSADARYILYAPEPFSAFRLEAVYGFDELDGLRDILTAVDESAFEKWHVVIKAHPNQPADRFRAFLLERVRPNVSYLDSGDLPALMSHADAVLGFFSNSLVEAFVLGRPVIRPLLRLKSGAPDPLQNLDGVRFLTARSRAELRETLRTVLRAHTH